MMGSGRMLNSTLDWQLFAQPIYTLRDLSHRRLREYELLIRDADGQVPLQRLQHLVSSAEGNRLFWQWKTSQLLPTLKKQRPGMPGYWINIEPVQFNFASTWQFLQQFVRFRNDLMIEITERPVAKNEVEVTVPTAVHRLHRLGYRLAMDDVGTGQNQLNLVRLVSDDVQRIKLSLYMFRQHRAGWNSIFQQWDRFARANRLEMVVEVINSATTARIIYCQDPHCLQQGFYYGKPTKLSEIIK